MRVTLLTGDWAEALNGKLYIQGAGWTRIRSNVPVNLAIAAIVHVDYQHTNQPATLKIRILTEDGNPYPPDAPLATEGQVEVGRPPGMRPGEESNVPLALSFGSVFTPGGYVIEAELNGTVEATAPFTALENL